MALSVDNLTPAGSSLPAPGEESETKAALKVQKVYRSYRTRRRLADSVVSEQLWYQALDYASLNHTTVSFFNFHKPEKAATRWCRVSSNASKVGKGLCQDGKAKKLAFQHWVEAIDPRHRYGHNLNFYYEEWRKGEAGQPFFYWLDIGDGKEIDHKECSRSRLREQSIQYLGPQERERYEYIIEEGVMVHKETGDLLDTEQELQGSNKWIFVLSSSRRLYAGKKRKGRFHHSSFLAGGATLAAGSLVAHSGKPMSVSAYSGHYRPTEENLGNFTTFLEENGVDLDQVQVCNSDKTGCY